MVKKQKARWAKHNENIGDHMISMTHKVEDQVDIKQEDVFLYSLLIRKVGISPPPMCYTHIWQKC